MKTPIYYVLILIMGLSGCASQKKLETATPFQMGQAICQEWVAGRAESGSGHIVKVMVTGMDDTQITPEHFYFRGRMAKAEMQSTDEGMMISARFTTNKPDMVMHADSVKEVGNQAPKMKTADGKKFPFELQRDEAILSYKEGDEEKYVKISGVADKPAKIYPSRPQN